MKQHFSSVTVTLAMALLSGCASPRYQPPMRATTGGGPALMVPGKALIGFAGGHAAPITATGLIDAIVWAEVIILGEKHDDANAHAAQLEITRRVLAIERRSALSMEMLERDEQALVDDYLDGTITAEAFARETFSTKWAGEGSWDNWYQPIIDAAKEQGAAVVAANAPRRYVRLASKAGYDRLRALPAERRALIDLPSVVPSGRYVERFREVMRSHPAGTGDDKAATGDAAPVAAPAEPPPPMTAKQAEQLFGGQSVWDATMAASIVKALGRGSRKVVHLVGQFHSDFDGGLVQELRARRPGVRVLTISFQPVDAVRLRDEDRGRADIVIYTGEIPKPEPKPEEASS